MTKRTVSLEDLTPEQVANMAATYRALCQNPDTREQVLRATKKLDPSLSISEIDVKDMLADAEAKRLAREEAETLKQLEREAMERIQSGRRSIKEMGFGDEDVTKIEKLMTDSGIANYATAADHFRMQQELAVPTPTLGVRPQRLEMPKDFFNAGKKNIAQVARDTAATALDEIRTGRIKLAA